MTFSISVPGFGLNGRQDFNHDKFRQKNQQQRSDI